MRPFACGSISEARILYDSEQCYLEPPCLTAEQEEAAEQIKRFKEIDREILMLLEEKDEVRDWLSEKGILM